MTDQEILDARIKANDKYIKEMMEHARLLEAYCRILKQENVKLKGERAWRRSIRSSMRKLRRWTSRRGYSSTR